MVSDCRLQAWEAYAPCVLVNAPSRSRTWLSIATLNTQFHVAPPAREHFRSSRAMADQHLGTWAKAFTSSTDPRLDIEIPLAKAEPTAARNYPSFSQREIDAIQI